MSSTCHDLPHFANSVINLTIQKAFTYPANRGKIEHLRRNFNYDKGTFRLPRQTNCRVALSGQNRANRGKLGQVKMYLHRFYYDWVRVYFIILN